MNCIERLIESNAMFVNSSEMSSTINDVIDDCRDNVHFSRKLLENYWSKLDDNVYDMINTLGKQIYDQLIESVREINIPNDINLLVQFIAQANISNIPNIVQRIDADLFRMAGLLEKVNSTNSTLPQGLVQLTIDEVSSYKNS